MDNFFLGLIHWMYYPRENKQMSWKKKENYLQKTESVRVEVDF